MKQRIAVLRAIFAATLLMLFPMHAAYAHHESWMGSAFWHDVVHVLVDGGPWVLLASAGLLVIWYLRRRSRGATM